jgi:hypothetical protein
MIDLNRTPVAANDRISRSCHVHHFKWAIVSEPETVPSSSILVLIIRK